MVWWALRININNQIKTPKRFGEKKYQKGMADIEKLLLNPKQKRIADFPIIFQKLYESFCNFIISIR